MFYFLSGNAVLYSRYTVFLGVFTAVPQAWSVPEYHQELDVEALVGPREDCFNRKIGEKHAVA